MIKKQVTQLHAIGFALLAFAVWVFSDGCMKLAGEASLPPYEIIGFLGMFGAVPMAFRAWMRGNIKTLWPKHVPSQLTRALLGFALNFTEVIALKHLPLALFYIAIFTAPIMTSLLAAFFLREKLSISKVLAIIAGFTGVVIAVNPFAITGYGDWIGYAAAFINSLGFAVNLVWMRRMTQHETSDSLVFFNTFIQMVFGFGLTLIHAEPVSWQLFLILSAMGILSLIGNLAFYQAVKNTLAATISQFHYTQLIFGAVLGYFIWHDVPSLPMVAGAAIIIAAGLYIAKHTHLAQKRPETIPH